MTYLEQLGKAHQIEVAGEAAYLAAGRYSRSAEHKRKWMILAQLETQTKRRIEDVIAGMGGAVRERRVDVWIGSAAGCLMVLLPWSLALRFLCSITDHATSFWEDLARTHADGDKRFHGYLIAHEKAQSEFARHELQGNGEASVVVLQSLLDG